MRILLFSSLFFFYFLSHFSGNKLPKVTVVFFVYGHVLKDADDTDGAPLKMSNICKAIFNFNNNMRAISCFYIVLAERVWLNKSRLYLN